jgi:hypothetical protein
MRALFGVVSLLVVLAIVGLIGVKQLTAVGHVAATSTPQPDVAQVPAMSGSGTVNEQAVQLENKVANDVVKAMNQGAQARQDEAEKQSK